VRLCKCERTRYEADDFLAAAVAAEERRGGTALVASGDRDTFQLASETTTILHPLRGGEIARIGPAEVRERYGVDPKQVPDLGALRVRDEPCARELIQDAESFYSPDELMVEVERLAREDAQNATREAEQREERNTGITHIYGNEHGANGAT
jgi:5'-3' exonuclease, N-terminal resolvase-like domain